MKPVFAIQDIPTGQLNALVKTLMRQMRVSDPAEAVRRINSREWTATKAVSCVSEKDGLFHVALPQNQYSGEGSIEELVTMREVEVVKSILATYEKRYAEGFPSSNQDRFPRRKFVIVPGTRFCRSRSGDSMVGVHKLRTVEGTGAAAVSSSLLDNSTITNARVYEFARSQGLEPCIHRDAGLLMEHLAESDWKTMGGLWSIRVMHDHKPVNLIPECFLGSPKPDRPEVLKPEILIIAPGEIGTTPPRGDDHQYRAAELSKMGFAFYKPS